MTVETLENLRADPQTGVMDHEPTKAPRLWTEQLALADADIALGRTFPFDIVIAELHAELAELKAEIARKAQASVADEAGR